MEDETPTTADLLAGWRETKQAAELAERLALLASEAADQADRNAAASEEIARMAERAAKAAERAALTARSAAQKATEMATQHRARRLRDAETDLAAARSSEAEAGQRYQQAEADARKPL